MTNYTISGEATRILNDVLLNDPGLNLPPSFKDAAKKVEFVADDDKPFVLTPFKITESCASLTALLATAANVAAAERYGIGLQDVQVNTDVATLFLASVLLPTIGGKSFVQHPKMAEELSKMDLHRMSDPIRRYATNVYKTKDGRWYHLHGSMNAEPTMRMMGVSDFVDVSPDEAIKIYADKVAQWDSEEIERTANEQHKQAGVVCYTPDEFFSSEHGNIMSKEPLWSATRVPAPRKEWPRTTDHADFKPLAGIRIIDFSRVIAAPAVSKLLSLLGADVLRVSCDKLPEYAPTMVDLQTGKRDANLDLKTDEGRSAFAELVKGADVLVDGYRPGVLERLGFDSATLRKLSPSLIYMRENCYGFKGPLAHRSGWQQISDCLVGLSHLQGKFLGLDEAVVPLLPNSDYQTGLVGAVAAVQALLARTKEDVTFDIDISLTQYNIWYIQLGLYSEDQQRELRARDPQFLPRHCDDMNVLVGKTHASWQKVRPDLFTHPEYFWDMSGKEYGLDQNIKVLAPAFKFSSTTLAWEVPTGKRGRSKPEWVS
ncbi:formyl-CoA transferase [Colletotrichum higginsianum]|uniref:Formyl-CoA transferase n=2 Tax=Colletotrichum higginsianum TaxID=80884 RepID=H1VFY8_COLHI|nr:Formyl-CoA transferase [Colletotrichum higginsianum IMI 349063]OBR03016.1 Formyl-CoA transferase [Colletotrichum higginsianum IMI 349063]TIC91194.1 Succinyl-CoA--L-malate CoA-transferase beta subunit [Colletotrichum higginsianum]CCF39141.1 formyl-CoA transferase [Colletotrichum higginsianum]